MKGKWTRGTRLLSLAAAIALIAGAVTGCTPSNTASDKDEEGRTVISVGSWPTKEGSDKDAIEARKARYEEENPDAVIEPDEWAFDLKTFYSKAAGGQLPTVYGTHFTEISQIISAGYSADLTDALQRRGYEGKFNEQILDLVSKDGRIYAFPYAAYILGLAFNTEMLEAAGLMNEDGTPQQPATWDEVAEFAVRIKEATGKPGFVFPTANNNGGWMFTCLAWSFGADFMEQDADGNWKATFNSPEAAAALQYIKDLKWEYDVLPSNTLIDGTEYYKQFATGNAGMLMSAGDIPRKLVQYGMTPDQVGMMAMPAGPERHVTLLGGSIQCISNTATEDQIDAALRWIETSYSYEATDEYKQNSEVSIDLELEKNQLVGIKSMSTWSSDTESVSFLHGLIDEKANSNPNHVRLYNEFVADCPAEIQPEEPVCAQELYGILDGCIQEVLTNENTDCAALLEKANSDFQSNYLDNLDY